MNTRWLIQYLALGHSVHDDIIRTLVHFTLFDPKMWMSSLYVYVIELTQTHGWFLCNQQKERACACPDKDILMLFQTTGKYDITPYANEKPLISFGVLAGVFYVNILNSAKINYKPSIFDYRHTHINTMEFIEQTINKIFIL